MGISVIVSDQIVKSNKFVILIRVWNTILSQRRDLNIDRKQISSSFYLRIEFSCSHWNFTESTIQNYIICNWYYFHKFVVNLSIIPKLTQLFSFHFNYRSWKKFSKLFSYFHLILTTNDICDHSRKSVIQDFPPQKKWT